MLSASFLALALLAAAADPPPGRGLDPAKAVTQYAIDVWTTEKGLPNNTVNAVLQTRDGYLWFGTYDGLARFDGVRFTVYNRGNTDALKDAGVRVLCEDKSGALWIGTNGGGLTRLAGGTFTHHSPSQGPANDMIWALHPDPRGGLWVGTNAGTLYHLREGRFETVLSSSSRESIYTILHDRQGQLWVGTLGAGLKRRGTDGEWTTYTAREGLPNDFVRTILEDRGGSLWIGTLGGGVSRLDQGRFTSYSLPQGLPDDVVYGLLEDRHGTLWLATRRGLARWREGSFSTLGQAQGLPDEVVYSLFEDREGSLWVGTGVAGAVRVRDGSFTTYTTREGLTDDLVYPIYEDAAGSVWVGTSRGLNRFQDGRWTQFRQQDGLCHDAVRSLWGSPEGDLWIGTYGGGVCRRRAGRWERYTTREGLAHDNVRAVLGTRDGSIWIGTVAGLSRLTGSRWSSFATEAGLPTGSVICLAEDKQGNLWVGTDGGGLARYREGRFETYAMKDGLPSNVVLALLPDRDGTLWAGTSGGLAHVSGGRIAGYTTREGLPGDSVLQVLDDEEGNLWLGGSRGIHRLGKRALLEPYRARHPLDPPPLSLGTGDGMRSSHCMGPAQPGGFRTRDGRLWFATAGGVAVLDPRRVQTAAEPPPVVIESVTADERELELPGALTLAPGTARVAFHYTGLSLRAPDKVRFRYRLAGFDEDWVDAGDRRVAYYTGLPPGEYRFEVTGRVGGGPWNPAAASRAVRLEPRFHQTRTFLALVAGAVVAAALGAHRFRVGRLEARERVLAQLVEERTRKLQEEKERAEAAHREAERRKKIAEEASTLKTELLGIAAHDLSNPLQVVIGMSEILSASTDPRVADPSKLIFKSSERMLDLIGDLLATAALEGKVELHLEPMDLSRLAAAVVEEYRPRAELKGQSLQLGAGSKAVARVDEGRMREVMENLVSNAVKFSRAGTTIHVEVAAGEDLVRFEVRDQGPGLRPEEIPKLFGRYQRLSAQPTGGEPSTGLGLYIVKRLVDLFGGRVSGHSDGPGKGSRFVVELPRAE